MKKKITKIKHITRTYKKRIKKALIICVFFVRYTTMIIILNCTVHILLFCLKLDSIHCRPPRDFPCGLVACNIF